MKLVAFMLLALIGFTADAAFALGVMGTVANLPQAGVEVKPGTAMYITGDIFAILFLFIAINLRVRRLIREAAQHTPIVAEPRGPATR